MTKRPQYLAKTQEHMLQNLARMGGTCETIMQLVRQEWAGRGHFASYARFHRLRRRGLVSVEAGKPALTTRGSALLRLRGFQLPE